MTPPTRTPFPGHSPAKALPIYWSPWPVEWFKSRLACGADSDHR